MPYVKRRATYFLVLMVAALVTLIAVLILMMTSRPARAYQPSQQPMFGTYSRAYTERQQAKRWRELCKGGGRYQAMSEAYEAGKPDPCQRR